MAQELCVQDFQIMDVKAGESEQLDLPSHFNCSLMLFG